MSKKKRSGGNGSRTTKGVAVGHLLPVNPRGELGDGWLVCVTPEDGDVVVLQPLERAFLVQESKLRSRIAPGIWWLGEHKLDLENVRDAIADATFDAHYASVEFCDDCFLGDPCGAMGNTSAIDVHGFLPKAPPAPTLDSEAVEVITNIMLDAHDDDLAFEMVQAAFARFCALRPRKAQKNAPTMTAQDAAKVLDLELPANKAAIESAFRSAVKRAHPDAGGTDADMSRVVEAKRALDAASEAQE